jgi:hypothetical protein
MARSQPSCKRPAFLRVLYRDRFPFADLHAKAAKHMAGKVHGKMSGRQSQAADDFDEVDLFDPIKRFLDHKNS